MTFCKTPRSNLQARERNERAAADAEDGPRGERQEVEAGRRDVLAEVTRARGEAVGAELVVEFLRHEVHLTQVRLRRVALDARAVLHGGTAVRVAFHSDAGDEHELADVVLRERVRVAAVQVRDGTDHGMQRTSVASRGGRLFVR